MAKNASMSGKYLIHLCHYAVVAALVACVLSTAGVLMIGSVSLIGRNILLSVVVGTMLSFAALRCAHVYASGQHASFALLILSSCVIAFVISLLAIWDVFTSVWVVHLAGLAINVAIAGTHLCIMMPIRQAGPAHPLHVRIAASGTMVSTVVCALLIACFFLGSPIATADMYIQLILIMLVITLVGTVLTPVLIQMHHHRIDDSTSHS